MSARVEDKGRKGKHLNTYERGRIAALNQEGYTPYRIGKILGRAADTIRNELKRGTITVITGHWKDKTAYFPDTGQAVYEKNRKRCREPLKAKRCRPFIEYVEDEVLKKKRSFDAVRGHALRKGLFTKDEVVCVTTLYTYADKGIIGVSNIDLPEKVSRRLKKPVFHRRHKRLRGRSIEDRPKLIDEKAEFGHWEIDLVIGKQSDDDVLLTMTERKTKMEIIEKIKGKTVVEVMKALKRIEERTLYYDKIFKSITSDNGTEFSHLFELEEGKSVRVYYAHPYSSWERGLNESTNRIVRRFIPKGRAVRRYSRERIAEIAEWINTLPRRILQYRTAEEAYNYEVERIIEEEERNNRECN